MSRKNKSKKQSYIVDVVITTGGRWDMLRKCLEAVKGQTVPVHIIIIDHNSPHDERIQNEELFSGVSTKRIPQDVGFPAANNEGARMGTAPLILFLNDDCVLEPDAIEKMVGTMDEKNIGICGAKLLFPKDSTSNIRPAGRVQHVGICLSIRGDTYHPLNGWNPDNPKTRVSRDVFAVTGACLMVRRSLFNMLRGFDLIYGAGTYEDVDLCLKSRSVGQRVFVNAEAIGYHYTGATAEKKKTAYPLQVNSGTFKSRWINTPLMMWDEWTWY